MISKLDLTEEIYDLPLTLIIDGNVTELTLTDVPLSVYKEFVKGAAEDKIGVVESYALKILNSNREGRVFDESFLEKLGAAKLSQLVTAYTEWLNEVLHEKN